jgi:hypothetical protein
LHQPTTSSHAKELQKLAIFLSHGPDPRLDVLNYFHGSKFQPMHMHCIHLHAVMIDTMGLQAAVALAALTVATTPPESQGDSWLKQVDVPDRANGSTSGKHMRCSMGGVVCTSK